jgi:hypothetical protein
MLHSAHLLLNMFVPIGTLLAALLASGQSANLDCFFEIGAFE